MKDIFHKSSKIQKLISTTLLVSLIFSVSKYGFVNTSDYIPITASIDDLVVDPALYIDDDQLGTSFGNENGRIDAGETIEMDILLKNQGITTIDQIYVNLTTNDPFTTIITNFQEYNQIEPDQSGAGASYFIFAVNSSCPTNHEITFYLNQSQSWERSFTVTVYGNASLVFQRYSVVSEYDGDRAADDDDIIDKGEEVEIRVYIQNYGVAIVRDLELVLYESIEDSFVNITEGENSLNSIEGNGVSNVDFTILVKGTCPDKRILNFTIQVIDQDYTTFLIPFSVVVNGTPRYEILDVEWEQYSDYGDDDNYLDAGEKWSVGIVIQNIGDAKGKMLWAVVYSIDEYIEWYEDDYSQRIINLDNWYSNNLEIGENGSFSDSYDWRFEIADNTPKNHQISISILIGDEITSQEFLISFIVKEGVSVIEGFMNLNLFLTLIGVLGWVIFSQFISKKVSRSGRRLVKLTLLVFIMVNLFIYLTSFSMYYLIALIPLVYCMICYIALRASGQWKNIGRPFRRMTENYQDRKYQRKRKREEELNRRKSERLKEKAEHKLRNDPDHLIILAQEAVTRANNKEQAHNFDEAQIEWTEALGNYKKALKHIEKERRSEIGNIIYKLEMNIGFNYFEAGRFFKNQGKAEYKKKAVSKAKILFETAVRYYKQGVDYFQKEIKREPELSLPRYIEKIQKYEGLIHRIDFEEKFLKIEKLEQQFAQIKLDDSNIMKAKELLDQALRQYEALGKELRMNGSFVNVEAAVNEKIETITRQIIEFKQKFNRLFDVDDEIFEDAHEEEEIESILKPKSRATQQTYIQRIPSEEIALLQKLQKILKIWEKFQLDDIAYSLGISRKELMTHLVVWGDYFDFKVQNNEIVFKDKEKMMEQLNHLII